MQLGKLAQCRVNRSRGMWSLGRSLRKEPDFFARLRSSSDLHTFRSCEQSAGSNTVELPMTMTMMMVFVAEDCRGLQWSQAM